MKRINCVVLVVVLAACQPTKQPVTEASELPRHELIFSRHSDAARTDYDIWRMCADGTQLASLVTEPGIQFQVSIAPDGSEFVYASRVDGKFDVWQKSFGRGEAVNLTAHPAEDSQPAWSPDGDRIAFFSDRDAEKLELYVMRIDDGSIERLTENTFYDSGASWSPDGLTIIFTRYFPGTEDGAVPSRGEIVALEVATRAEVQLTDLGGYNGGPSFSPDGGQIAFHRSSDDGVELWLVNADGSDPRAITDTFVDEYSPAWSPDGQWLAITSGTGHDGLGTFDIWLMRPDGSDRRLVSAAANTEAWQQWRPGEHYCR